LTQRLTERSLAAGGKFYLAKDSALRTADVERAGGHERIARFLILKPRLDPTNLLTSDLWSRALAPST
jgi:hypothetical protein